MLTCTLYMYIECRCKTRTKRVKIEAKDLKKIRYLGTSAKQCIVYSRSHLTLDWFEDVKNATRKSQVSKIEYELDIFKNLLQFDISI